MLMGLLPGGAACGGGLPGLAPEAQLARPPIVYPGARFSGAALGWTLGSEAHVFVTDAGFAQQLYTTALRLRLEGDRPALVAAAFGERRLLTLAASRVPRRPRDPGYYDASILHRGGAVPAALELIRMHRPGNCSAPGIVTELVYSIPQAALPVAPPSQTAVVALFRTPALLVSRPVAEGRGGSGAPARALARRVITRVARAAERLTANGPQAGIPAEPLARGGELALDPELAADAGEIAVLPATTGRRPLAAAFRARFRTPEGDTVLVSGVALTDSTGRGPHWVLRPVRERLVGGLVRRPGGTRYVLRGAVAYPPAAGELLLVDRIADVAPADSRALVVEPERGGTGGGARVVAAQPLALRCR
ncbi:MAG: hypothetical protein ACREL9_00430 [Gemmatimonadales bacterium]